MASESKIEWTDATWNPIVGCSVVSPGCTNCYAMRFAGNRLDPRVPHYAGTTQRTKAGPVWTGKVALASDATLTEPLRWRRPRRIFVNSMGDLFHESVPDEWIDRVFAVMALCTQHTFQVLTKRSGRMRAYFEGRRANFGRASDALYETITHGFNEDAHQIAADRLDYFDSAGIPQKNIWLGVSAEDQQRADERVPDLLATPAAVRFVSAEPLLGEINFWTPHIWMVAQRLSGLTGDDVPGLDWIIVGGESGSGARPMHPDWARSIRDQCAAAGVAFFYKQAGEWAALRSNDGEWPTDVGGFIRLLPDGTRAPDGWPMQRVGKARAGRVLDGRTHDEMPAARTADARPEGLTGGSAP